MSLTTLADFETYRWKETRRMGKLATKALGALLLCTSLLLFDGIDGQAEAREALSADTLRQQIPGAKIQVDTPLGSVVPVTYSADGTLEGKAGAVAFFLGSQKDRGKWWIEGSKLCQRWDTWFNGRINCARVYRTAENRIEWIDQDGEKGTGTVVEFSKTPPPALVKPAPAKEEKSSRQTATVAAPTPKPAPEVKQATTQAPATRKVAELKPPAPVAARAPTPPPAPEQKLSLNAPKPEKAIGSTPVPPAGKPHTKEEQVATFQVVNVPFDDVLNVRSGPSPTEKIVSTIRPRTRGIVIAGNCEGEWCPIQHGGSQGWVNRYFLTSDESKRRGALASTTKRNPLTYKVVGVAAGDVLNLRRRPDSEAAVVATIPPSGHRIRLTGYCVGEWCPVAYGQTSGWAHRFFLALEY